MEEERVVDHIAAFGLDADDGGVRRLVLPLVERPRVMDFEVDVHRARLLRPQAELERHLLVWLDLLDYLEALHFDGAADDRGHVLGGPVPLVRDGHLEPAPPVRLEAGVLRLEEEPRVAVLQDLLDARLRGLLRLVDERLQPLQVLGAQRVLRLQEQRLDVPDVYVDRFRVGDDRLHPREVDAALLQDRPATLAREGFLRPPEEVLHLTGVLLLDGPLDLRQV